MEKLPEVSKSDMWIMLMSTIRYSIGRRTYMPGLAGELVIKYENYLSMEQLKQIEREIREEIRMAERCGNTLGDM